MQFDGSVFSVLVIVVIAFVGLRLIESRLGHRLFESEAPDCEDEIRQLRAQLDEERERNRRENELKDTRIRELERRVEWLVGQLQRAGRVTEERPEPPAALPPAKPLLLVCGPDTEMCNLDRQSLRRAGISFQRLAPASKATVDDELRRRRQDGSLYWWLHITAHADDAGIALADGIAPPSWWSERLDGIKVVFLAACRTAAVADALAGLCTVIFVHEDIDNRDAADFTYAFWRRMREHGDPQAAYRQAILETPQVSEYTDIRVR
jgi:hypothetical protein